MEESLIRIDRLIEVILQMKLRPCEIEELLVLNKNLLSVIDENNELPLSNSITCLFNLDTEPDEVMFKDAYVGDISVFKKGLDELTLKWNRLASDLDPKSRCRMEIPMKLRDDILYAIDDDVNSEIICNLLSQRTLIDLREKVLDLIIENYIVWLFLHNQPESRLVLLC
jgi:hypothetical protein